MWSVGVLQVKAALSFQIKLDVASAEVELALDGILGLGFDLLYFVSHGFVFRFTNSRIQIWIMFAADLIFFI